MSALLTISVPEEVLRDLRSRAAIRGVSVEAQAVADLAAVPAPPIHHVPGVRLNVPKDARKFAMSVEWGESS